MTGMEEKTVRRLQSEIATLPRSGLDVAGVFRETHRRLSAYIPTDGWCGLTLDPATLLMTGGVHEFGFAPEVTGRLLEIEHGEDDFNLLADLARGSSPVGLLSEATRGNLEASPRFRDVIRPSGFQHEVRTLARSGVRAWGALILMRGPSMPDFNQQDKLLLENVSAPIAEAIRGALLVAAAATAPPTSDRAVIVLGPGNELESVTPIAKAWLEDLAEFGPADPRGVPHSVQVIANEARRSAGTAAEDTRSKQARMRTRSGRWLTLHGTAMGEAGGRVAIMMEPSGPLEVASLILEAYGLTHREGELVHCVLHGFDTEQIGDLLGISTYTVQDHLKRVFDKVGVWSRKELVSRLFFKHYLPRMQQRLPLGPDGWFLERPGVSGSR